jgi:DNA-binding response OmpR family regulator
MQVAGRALVTRGGHHRDVILSGLDVIRAVRSYATTPIIVLCARTGSSDQVAALDLAADD